ncbi:ABC transporter ATP-binding protein [Maledivibacter halophilus]|uniref:Oligopeptide transport system ATP-binding protein n=1 Tax=Maledivibacter halophilus TaxID=36842 RepID=A0A1T5MDU8_9FIRM|nr:ABC transporter ATP-binding protein [Maledivibacter halophilus]SKC86154.1 oligopeptide transport system ATP-binding protein [Maledivibacter halophilus]
MSEKLLQINNLKTYFFTDEGVVRAIDDVSFSLKRGETLGIVGESGSGKSQTALSIMQLLENPGKIAGGEIIFEGKNLLNKTKKEMRKIRGNEIAMIFQEPMTSLNPVYTIGNQIMENIKLHQKLNKKEAREKTIEMLKLVNIPAPEKRIDEYPHQMSGGMRQRVMIAMALSCNPKLLICDEPTTALDVTIQAQILTLINQLKSKINTSIIMITHDLGVVSQVSENVLVMYAGKAMEYGKVKNIFKSPLHPYTEALIRSIPTIGNKQRRLSVIKGMVPNLKNRPEGCLFAPRCEYAKDICKKSMPEIVDIKGQKVRCWKYCAKWQEVE